MVLEGNQSSVRHTCTVFGCRGSQGRTANRKRRDQLSMMNTEMRWTPSPKMAISQANLGGTVLAGALPFLLYVDETWALQNLAPLLEPGSSDFVSAWDGLTYCRRITPRAAELLREPFLKAVERINSELARLPQANDSSPNTSGCSPGSLPIPLTSG